MAGKRGVESKWLLMALALPLVGLGIPAAPGSGAADAAVVKKARQRKVVVHRPAAKKVCTTRRVKGRKVTRCTAVKVAAAPAPVPLTVDPGAPAIGQPLPMVPVAAPPPMPVPPPIVNQRMVSPADYFWIDQADSLAQAFGNSPPDFTFDCDGIDCWAWLSRDGEMLIVEPGREGVQQYFFAVRQTTPYLVRDSFNSFAFDGRDLVVTYNSEGQVYPYPLSIRDRDAAYALRERGRTLYAASLRQRRWDRGAATAWFGDSSYYGYSDGWNYGWNPFWRELPDWDRYRRDRYRDRPPRHLDDEHRDRDEARRRYDDWHRRGSQGAPPPTGNPAVPPSGSGGMTSPPPRPPWHPAPQPPSAPQPAPQPAPTGQAGDPVPPPPPAPAPRPPWQPRPMPQQPVPPAPAPMPAQPNADTPAPPPAEAPEPRRERPRRNDASEPGAPPVPRDERWRQFEPPAAVQARPEPAMAPLPPPPPPPPPAPAVQYQPPAPQPAMVPPPMPVPAPAPAPAPVFVAPPPPAPPPPPPPPPREPARERDNRADSSIDGGERP